MTTKLPIDVRPNTDPPIFIWKQVVETLGGPREVTYEGPMPLTAESAIAEMVALVKRQARDIETLKKRYEGLAEVLASTQSKLDKVEQSVVKTAEATGNYMEAAAPVIAAGLKQVSKGKR